MTVSLNQIFYCWKFFYFICLLNHWKRIIYSHIPMQIGPFIFKSDGPKLKLIFKSERNCMTLLLSLV